MNFLTEISKRTTDSPEPGKCYLLPKHGRSSKTEDMTDWGESGGYIGPLVSANITYQSTISLEFEDGYSTGPCIGTSDDFGFDEDLLKVGQMFYGDYAVMIYQS